jgi:nicotinamide mononucleotide transporter
MYSGDAKSKHSALVYSMSHLLRGTAGQNGVLPHADSGIPERGAGLQALLQYGFTAFGERVSVAEFVGQLCALLVVLLAGHRTMWTWPVQVLATVLLFAVYTSAHLGGLAARQVVIFAISVYGWWAWTRRKDALYGVTVRTGTRTERLVLVVALVVGTVSTALLLSALSASWAPWPDAWIFVGSVVAFAGQGLGLVEFWIVWLAVDAVGVPLQIASGLYFSAVVYVVFAALVIHGWLEWQRTASERDVAVTEEASSR